LSFLKTLVLFIILLASVFYVYKTEYIGGQKAEEAKKQAKKIFNFKKDDVFRLRVRGGEDFEIEKQSGEWRIISPIEAMADDSEMEDFISYVSEAEFEEAISASEDQLGGFGLGVSARTIDFYVSTAPNEKPHRLVIGDYSPTMQKVYIKTSMAESVLTMKNIFKNRVSKTMFQLRRKRLLSGGANEITKMQITRSGERIVLEKEKNGKWSITEPLKTRADKRKTEDFIGKILYASAIEFADKLPDEKESGFKSSDIKVLLWKSGKEKPDTLLFGKKSGSGKGIWVKREGAASAALITPGFWDGAPRSVFDFRDRRIFGVLQADVASVAVSRNGGNFSMERKRGQWEISEPEKRNADFSKAAELVEILTGAEYVKRIEDVGEIPAEKPLAKISLKSVRDKTEQTLIILRYNDDKKLLVAKMEGDSKLLLLSPELLEKVSHRRLEEI